MIIVLSPAKKLATKPLPGWATGQVPCFWNQSMQLLVHLQQYSTEQLAKMMHLSPTLAQLNFARWQNFNQAQPQSGTLALFAFQGAVYQALDAASLAPPQCQWANDHLCILSGFYGLLQPFDWVQPHRLEMGTKIALPEAGHLYAFWAQVVTAALRAKVKEHAQSFVLNLASQEYAKVIDRRALGVPMIDVVFQEQRAGKLKTIGTLAKKARGLMARYLIDCQDDAQDIRVIQNFSNGYVFVPKLSSPERFVFVNQQLAS
jgi:uncharacterized protein